MTRVKICGCMRPEDALAAKEAGADFIGLMFAPESRRRLSIEQAQAVIAALGAPSPTAQLEMGRAFEGDAIAWFRHGAEALDRLLARKRPLTVGIFEDQTLDEANAIADECGLDLIQLSGREPWADCLRANRPVIKTIEPSPSDGSDGIIDGLVPGTAVACLLDVSRGRGVAVDRGQAAALAARLPVWLAGGLTPENVSDAVREVRPWAVDVSSGVETDGAKDAAKIHAFVQAAKGAAVG
ncbi:MAG: phosphoribosylanthranilate isomerase [Chloroflexi bacterium]|nr:phosphoribosylanthranilate isomerase [Chloroflexota bacterium]